MRWHLCLILCNIQKRSSLVKSQRCDGSNIFEYWNWFLQVYMYKAKAIFFCNCVCPVSIFVYIFSLYNSWLCPPAGAGCSWHWCEGLPNICHISSGRVRAGASTIFVAFPTCPIFTTAVRASTLHVKALALNKLNNHTGSQTKLSTLHWSSYKWLRQKKVKNIKKRHFPVKSRLVSRYHHICQTINNPPAKMIYWK